MLSTSKEFLSLAMQHQRLVLPEATITEAALVISV